VRGWDPLVKVAGPWHNFSLKWLKEGINAWGFYCPFNTTLRGLTWSRSHDQTDFGTFLKQLYWDEETFSLFIFRTSFNNACSFSTNCPNIKWTLLFGMAFRGGNPLPKWRGQYLDLPRLPNFAFRLSPTQVWPLDGVPWTLERPRSILTPELSLKNSWSICNLPVLSSWGFCQAALASAVQAIRGFGGDGLQNGRT